MFAIADRLGWSVEDVGALPAAEFDEWIEYLKMIGYLKVA